MLQFLGNQDKDTQFKMWRMHCLLYILLIFLENIHQCEFLEGFMIYHIHIYSPLALISLRGIYRGLRLIYYTIWISKCGMIICWKCHHFSCAVQNLLCIKHPYRHVSVSLQVVFKIELIFTILKAGVTK